MFPPGHIGITLLLYAPVAYVLVVRGRERLMRFGLFAVLLVTFLPDLDVFVPGVAHRGMSHSFAAAVYLGLAAGFVGWTSGWPVRARQVDRAAMGLFVGVFGVVSHLAGDVITPMGVRLFLPADPTVYTLDLVRARDPGANMTLFALGIAAFGQTMKRAQHAMQRSWPAPAATEPSPERSSVEPETTPREASG